MGRATLCHVICDARRGDAKKAARKPNPDETQQAVFAPAARGGAGKELTASIGFLLVGGALEEGIKDLAAAPAVAFSDAVLRGGGGAGPACRACGGVGPRGAGRWEGHRPGRRASGKICPCGAGAGGGHKSLGGAFVVASFSAVGGDKDLAAALAVALVYAVRGGERQRSGARAFQVSCRCGAAAG